MSKVVRVEQVDHPHNGDKNLTNNHSPSVERDVLQEMQMVPTTRELMATQLFSEEDQTFIGDEADIILESQDTVYELPANWPKIPEIERRRSCELIKSSTPCVKKAVSHLELIQNIIDDWFNSREEEDEEHTIRMLSSLRHSVILSAAPSKKQLRFLESRQGLHTSSSSVQMSSRGKDSVSSQIRATSLSSATVSLHESNKSPLSVQGIGGQADQDIPFLGADEVISEVIVLLARLDNDRIETEKLRKVEQEIVGRLSRKIDDLCLKRLRDLPALVQKEHEACILDLNELQWHVAYRRRTEHRIKERMESAELANTQYKEDLAFVKSHIPLVQEKLQLEVEAMDKIKRAQAETDQELQVTKQRQVKTEQKSEEAVSKAETERGHIKKELDTVRDNLTNISEELSEAKMLFNSYIHQVNDIKQQIKDNREEFHVLRIKNDNAKVAEEMQATLVRDLQTKITDAEFNRRQLENVNTEVEQDFASKKAEHAHEKFGLETKLKELETQLRTLTLKNQEAKMEIEDFEEKLVKCVRQKTADSKNLKRLVRDIESSEKLMITTDQEYSTVLTAHYDMAAHLQAEEDKAFRVEETLKNNVDTLRKQVKDEIHTRTVLQARINSDSVEIDRTREDSAKKSDKASKIAVEVEKAVNNVLVKVEKLRANKEVKDRQKNELKSNIESLQKQQEEYIRNFSDKSDVCQPHVTYLKEEILKLDKQLDQMKWKSDVMHKNIDDMDASSEMMSKVQASTEKIIKTLTDQYDELTIQLEASKKLEADLLEMYQGLLDRIHFNGIQHTKLQENRKVVLQTHMDDKWRAMKLNKELASKYRQLQNAYYLMKEEALRGYDDQVKLESALTDIRQLHALQKKLHGALMEYFKLSGLYNDSELVKLNEDAVRNGQHIGCLEDQMNTALDDITNFLTTQMDGEMARKMASSAMRKHNEKGWQTPMSQTASRPPSRLPALISAA